MDELKNIIRTDSKGGIVYNNWIEWEHFAIPNKPDWFRQIMRGLMMLLGHCVMCTVLDGCYFVERKMPKFPLHDNCDCKKIPLSYSSVKKTSKAECDIRKFTEYVFKDDIQSKGKVKIFIELGYTLDDSAYLQQEYCKQAREQYLNGNYMLKNLDMRGQRLSIPITLKNKTFNSGWMMYPEGELKNTTPFGGWPK